MQVLFLHAYKIKVGWHMHMLEIVHKVIGAC